MGAVKPKIKVIQVSETGEQGSFVFEPLERGLGHTLGNSLRRMLLSSLPGVAASMIKIDGVTHEFSTIDGVKEDVTDIVLNVKEIVASLEEVETKEVMLDVIGPTVVTVGMLSNDSEIKFLNPDFVLATVEENVRFRMQITFNRGVGYVTAEQNRLKLSADIGAIPVDSIYTPVLRVNNFVTNTRIGQITDFDKLNLEIQTNGVISAKEALSLAALELIEHLELLLSLNKDTSFIKTSSKNSSNFDVEHKDISVDDLELSVRAYNSLKRAGILTLQELGKMTKGEIFKIRNLGKKSFDEIIDKLTEFGYEFGDDFNSAPQFRKTNISQNGNYTD